MAFFSGMVHDVDAFLAGLEHEMAADFAPLLARARVAFTNALGDVEKQAYAAVKSAATKAIDGALANYNGDVVGLIHAVFAAVKTQLPSLGVVIEDIALHGLVTALVAATAGLV